MRIASYELPDGTASFGTVDGASLRDCGDDYRARFPDLASVISAGDLDGLRVAAASSNPLAFTEVSFLPPIPRPDKIICIGLNYMTHIRETGRDAPKYPPVFTRYPSSLVGHAENLVLPEASNWFDYEGELAAVIGTAARNVSVEEAMAYVAGYTCFNDGSVRDYQRHTSQFWAGKNFDRSGSVGPWILTADEIETLGELELKTRLNGQTVQSTSISDLAFDVPALVSYLSTVTTLLPGDVIATGTPSGVGLFREPKLFLTPGDIVEVEISQIGTLSNTVVKEH